MQHFFAKKLSSFREQFENKVVRARPSHERRSEHEGTFKAMSNESNRRLSDDDPIEKTDYRKADGLLNHFEEHQKLRKQIEHQVNEDRMGVNIMNWRNNERKEYPLRSLTERNMDNSSFRDKSSISTFQWASNTVKIYSQNFPDNGLLIATILCLYLGTNFFFIVFI